MSLKHVLRFGIAYLLKGRGIQGEGKVDVNTKNSGLVVLNSSAVRDIKIING